MQRLLRLKLRALRSWYNQRTATRTSGLRSELSFWDDWFRSGGLEWPADFQRRLDPDQPLTGRLAELVDRFPEPTIQILDVGAGPLTILGKTHPRKQLAITATDLLAQEYDVLLARYNITPPIRTVKADAENLTAVVPANYFHIVHAQNSLDHTRNPLRALEQMVRVALPGGSVVLEHRANEAEIEAYSGLHQWNFAARDGVFLISNPQQTWNVSEHFARLCQVECHEAGGWLSVHMHKR